MEYNPQKSATLQSMIVYQNFTKWLKDNGAILDKVSLLRKETGLNLLLCLG